MCLDSNNERHDKLIALARDAQTHLRRIHEIMEGVLAKAKERKRSRRHAIGS